jgi:hypothetical protein
MLKLNDAVLMLNDQYEPGDRPDAPPVERTRWHGNTAIYFGCRDVDGAYQHTRQQGIEAGPPYITGYGFKAVSIIDPDGYHLCFNGRRKLRDLTSDIPVIPSVERRLRHNIWLFFCSMERLDTERFIGVSYITEVCSMSEKAAQQKEAPKRPADLDKLEIFTGKWRMTGKQINDVVGPDAAIDVCESYEWLDGKYFLVHDFKGDLGGNDAACIEIIGYDPLSEKYTLKTFYNNGVIHDWTMTESIGTWIISGIWQIKDKEMKTRCTINFSEDKKSMTGKWEMSADGKTWQTFWDVTSTKTT